MKDTSSKRRELVFGELFTETEQLMISKRLMLIYLIKQNVPTHKISAALKMSPSTVARFEVRVAKGLFSNTAIWLKHHKVENQILSLLGDLLTIPFENKGKPMSLGRYIDEKL